MQANITAVRQYNLSPCEKSYKGNMNTTRKERFIQKATRLTVKVLLFSLLLSLFLYAGVGTDSALIPGDFSAEQSIAQAAVPNTSEVGNGTAVRLENNHDNTSGVAFLMAVTDWTAVSGSNTSFTVKSGNRGWGDDTDGSDEHKAAAYVTFPLSDHIKQAVNAGIKIGVKLTATKRGSGDNDWGAIAIYYAAPTSLNVSSETSWTAGDWENVSNCWFTNTPSNAVAYSNWVYSNPSDLTAGGSTSYIPSGTTNLYLTFYNVADGGWGQFWDNIVITFYYQEHSYTVGAGANGVVKWHVNGTTPEYSNTIEAGDSVSGITNSATNSTAYAVKAVPNTGYHFTKWSDNNTSTTRTFTGYNVAPSATYTANFAVNTATIVYNANGGSGSISNQTITYGTDFKLASSGLSRTNYVFVGWSNSSGDNNSANYSPGQNFTDDKIGSTDLSTTHGATITLYAVWKGSDFGVTSGKSKTDGTWGSESNPFVIENNTHLANLSEIVNGTRDPVDSITGTYYGTARSTNATTKDYAGCFFIVSADVSISYSDTGLRPIGSSTSTPFKGNFNGNSKTITVNASLSGVDYVGLFGYMNAA